MSIVRWAFPTQILFGVGAVKQTGAELAKHGVKRALVVTDAGVKKAGLLEPVLASLAAAGLETAVYDGVIGNPLEKQVDDGIAAYRAHRAEGVAALGGGSSLDVAKLVALRVEHDRPLADYDDAKGGDALVTGNVPPIVSIPTTAGTGSEVGRSGVVTLAATGRKTVIFSPKFMARAAILDPEMTRTMPPFISAATGFDALTHCVEAYLSTGDHPMCDGVALAGVRLCAKSLRRVVTHGDDLEARGDMLKAAMMGAVAFQKGLGACHSLAHPLSSVSGLHHGLANALCLPAVVRFNAQDAGCAAKYREIAHMLGAKGDDCAAALAELRAAIGLPNGLGAAGVKEIDLDKLADEAIADACHTLNPRPCTRADLLALYKASW
jgi:4-hydroxybutyrate dehydrogenase